MPLSHFDGDGRRVAPGPDRRGRLVLLGLVASLVATSWSGGGTAALWVLRGAGVLVLVVAVVVWFVRPLLEDDDQ